MVNFIIQHPIVILYLAAGWFVAAVISAMPPLKENAGFFTTWAYNVAQIVGASLDKVGKAAAQNKQFQQFEQTLQSPDGSVKTASITTTVQDAPASPKS